MDGILVLFTTFKYFIAKIFQYISSKYSLLSVPWEENPTLFINYNETGMRTAELKPSHQNIKTLMLFIQGRKMSIHSKENSMINQVTNQQPLLCYSSNSFSKFEVSAFIIIGGS